MSTDTWIVIWRKKAISWADIRTEVTRAVRDEAVAITRPSRLPLGWSVVDRVMD